MQPERSSQRSRRSRLILLILFLYFSLSSVYSLKCRSDDGPTDAELKSIARRCMRKIGDNSYLPGHNNGAFGSAGMSLTHQQQQQQQQQQQRYGQSSQGGNNYYGYRNDADDDDDDDYDGNYKYGGDMANYNKTNHNNNHNNNNGKNDNNNNNNNNNHDNHYISDIWGQRNRERMQNRQHSGSAGTSSSSSSNNARNSKDQSNGNGGGGGNKYQHNYPHNNNNNNNNNNDNKSNNKVDKDNNNNTSIDAACIVHCFFAEMNMLNQEDVPDRHKVTYMLTKDLRDRELRSFYTEAVEECFHYLESQRGHTDRCHYSRNLIDCMTEYARINCEDWDNYNLMFN